MKQTKTKITEYSITFDTPLGSVWTTAKAKDDHGAWVEAQRFLNENNYDIKLMDQCVIQPIQA
jgi:uncharacterized lipoprotein